MKKTRLKLKKGVWVGIVILIFLSIGTYAGVSIYKDIQYKKTDQYKLLELGYTSEEITKLQKNLGKSYIEELLKEEKNTFILNLLDEEYYLSKNLDRYLNYHKDHLDYPVTKIVKYVNTNNDYAFYDHDIESNINDDALLIVNKFYHLNADYEPEDLVEVSNKYYYGENHKVRSVLYESFKNMWAKAYDEGIYLIINSSYRTFAEQKEVYDDYKDSGGTTYADKIAARPGYSEHQTGLAVDIFSKENTTTANFKGSPAYNWLVDNAYNMVLLKDIRRK